VCFLEAWRSFAPDAEARVIRRSWTPPTAAATFDALIQHLQASGAVATPYTRATDLQMPSFLRELLPFSVPAPTPTDRYAGRIVDLPVLTERVRSVREWIISNAGVFGRSFSQTVARLAREFAFEDRGAPSLGNPQFARRAWLAALEHDPADVEARRQVAIRKIIDGDMEASEMLSSVLSERPELRESVLLDAMHAAVRIGDFDGVFSRIDISDEERDQLRARFDASR
jgi:hypothetical protein